MSNSLSSKIERGREEKHSQSTDLLQAGTLRDQSSLPINMLAFAFDNPAYCDLHP